MLERSPKGGLVDTCLRGFFQGEPAFMNKLANEGVQQKCMYRIEFKYYFYEPASE